MAGSGIRGGGQAHSHSWKLKKAARKIVQTCGSFSSKDTLAPAVINDPLSLKSSPSPSPSPSVVVPPVLTAFSCSSSTNVISPAPKPRMAASSSGDTMSEHGVAAAETRAEEAASYASQTPSSTTKSLCAICLDPLSYGIGTTSPGRAIFTAQCSHAFHFACITSNIHHGSVTCPICRAHWTQLPHRLNPPSHLYSCNQTDPVLQILDRSIATFRVKRRSFLRSARYDDDDPIEPDNRPPNHPRLRFTLVRVPPLTQHPCHPSCLHHYLQVTRPGFSCRGSHTGFAMPQPPRPSSSSTSYSPLAAAAAPGATVGQHLGAPARRKPHYPCSTNRAYLSVTLAHQPATDLVLVVSPNGPHLRLIKQAMALVVFSLRPMDRLAIVTYYSSSSAARVFPLRRMTSHGKRTALQVVDRLLYTGHVDPTEGLRKGIKILGDRAHKNPESCILHLSDSPMTRRPYHHQVQHIDDDDMKAASRSSSSIPIHRFHVGFGFGTTTNGLVMLEFEEFLGRVLGGVVKDIQLKLSIMNGEEEKESSCRRRMVRLGELRGGEERRIPLFLGKSGHVSVEYSYSEYHGVNDDNDEYCCSRTGEIVVGIGGDAHERERVVDDAGNGTFAFAFAFALASSSSEQDGCGHNIVHHHHDPYRARRWAKLLHAYRL